MDFKRHTGCYYLTNFVQLHYLNLNGNYRVTFPQIEAASYEDVQVPCVYETFLLIILANVIENAVYFITKFIKNTLHSFNLIFCLKPQHCFWL